MSEASTIQKILKFLEQRNFNLHEVSPEYLTFIAGDTFSAKATIHRTEGKLSITGRCNQGLEFTVTSGSFHAMIRCLNYSPKYHVFGKSVKLFMTEEEFFQKSMVKDLSWTTFEEYDTLNKLRTFFDDEVRNMGK